MTGHPNPDATWTEDARAPLLAYIRGRVREDDAEDILHEVFARALARRTQLADDGNLLAWLHRIARNAIVDYHRRRARTAADPAPPEVVDDEPTSAAHELGGCLEALVARLPETYRDALRLTEIEGLTQAEAARRLGTSVTAMKSRVQRGRQRVRDLLFECCTVEFDRRGGVAEYERRDGGCDCDCG